MARFIPKSEHKRHQSHIDAFSHSKHTYQFHKLITQYIFDPNISPSNSDDVEIFINILFDSGYGKYHISYYEEKLKGKNGKYRRPRTKMIRQISRYAEFLDTTSQLMLDDLFDSIVNYRIDDRLVEEFLVQFTPNIKTKYVLYLLANHKYLIRQFPKLKFYATFL